MKREKLKSVDFPLMCPFSFLSSRRKRVRPHPMVVMLCRNQKDLFAVCNLHRVRMFVVGPLFISEESDEPHEEKVAVGR